MNLPQSKTSTTPTDNDAGDTHPTGRGFLRGSVALGAAVGASGWGTSQAIAEPHPPAMGHPDRDEGARVVLAGTAGGPPPATGRHGISSALIVGKQAYVVDAGSAATHQLYRAGIDYQAVRGIFVTHLHSDHIATLFNVVWLNWLPGSSGTGSSHSVDVIGPGRAGGLPPASGGRVVHTVNPDNPTPGTVDHFESCVAANAYDINERMRDTERGDIRDTYTAHDIQVPEVGAGPDGPFAPKMEPFVVFEDDAVRVSAILVDHQPVYPSFAFRFDTDAGSVVFSGDTAPCENMVRLAHDADVLVHEVIAIDYYADLGLPPAQLEHLKKSHTDVDVVGSLAQRAGVSTLVLTHLVPADVGAINEGTWRRKASQGFDGEVIVGHDLMEIPVGRRPPGGLAPMEWPADRNFGTVGPRIGGGTTPRERGRAFPAHTIGCVARSKMMVCGLFVFGLNPSLPSTRRSKLPQCVMQRLPKRTRDPFEDDLEASATTLSRW